ncbi:MAG: hypothetical protein ACSHYB_13035 [Roseibacillus sp.]
MFFAEVSRVPGSLELLSAFYELGKGLLSISSMTTQEIQEYIEAAMSSKFDGYTTESAEMMTSEGGDGRFFGKVFATRYAGLPKGQMLFLVVGETEKKIQIVKFGNTESLTPSETDLDLLLLKELGVEIDEE